MSASHDPTRTIPPADGADATRSHDPEQTGDALDNRTPTNGVAAPVSSVASTQGRYLLGERIASGGMGDVYFATDTLLARKVAVKVLQNRYASDSQTARRFAHEARIAAQLQHPNIPAFHDFGTLPDGRPFLVMKLIEGSTLDELLKSCPDPARDRGRFVASFEQVCQALAYAHAHSVIHRDLKPANIMVGAFGEVQVMDWGLAKVIGSGGAERIVDDETAAGTAVVSLRDGDDLLTRDGSILGTPAFMPPEQAVGAVEAIDTRSDVFGLGAVLAVVLTGRPPYVSGSSESTRVMAARGDLDACFARLDGSGADLGLVELCKRCLAARREDRPNDAGVVAEAVTGLRLAAEDRARQAELDRVKAEGQRATAEARAAEERNTRREAEARAEAERSKAREQRKRRRVQGALAGALLLLVASGGASAWRDQKRDADQARVERESARAEADRLIAEAAARDARLAVDLRIASSRTAAAALLGQTERALMASDAERASAALAEVARRFDEGGIDELRPRLEECRTNLALLRQLDDIDDARWTTDEGKLPLGETIESRLRAAFAGYGIVPGVSQAEDAAKRINGAIVRERLLTSLEVWFVNRNRDEDLRAILSKADPDGFRSEARATNYRRALLAWTFRCKVPPVQPVWFSIAHGDNRSLEPAVREKLLQAAHKARPDNFPLLMVLGSLPASEDREGAARRAGWYRAALTLRPGNTAAWNNLGVALVKSGDRPGAISAFEEAVALDPKNATAWKNLGIALGDIGDLTGAIAAHREAIRIDPKFAAAYDGLGIALKNFGDLAGAIAAHRQAIALDPQDAKAYSNLGLALKDCKDLPRAIAAHREAIRLSPNVAPSHYNLGVSLYSSGDLLGAIEAYKKAIALDPTLERAHCNMGVALQDCKDLPGAIAAYGEAIRLNPKNAKTHSNLGIALKASGDLPGAISEHRKAVFLDPKDAKAFLNLGAALKEFGDLHGAITAFGEAIKIEPKLTEAHFNLGIALYASGDLPSSAAAFKEAIKLDPRFAMAHHCLGVSYLGQKKYSEAIACVREAIETDPNLSIAHALLGELLVKTGDIPGARAAWTQAARLDAKRWGPLLAKLPPIPVAPPPREKK